jgi:hypothetical protein
VFVQEQGCIKTAFAVLKIEHVPETGEKAVRAIEEKIIQLNKTLPESYNRPLFDLSSLSPEQLSRLEQVNDGTTQPFRGVPARHTIVALGRLHSTINCPPRFQG